jgi:hypothetical protein
MTIDQGLRRWFQVGICLNGAALLALGGVMLMQRRDFNRARAAADASHADAVAVAASVGALQKDLEGARSSRWVAYRGAGLVSTCHAYDNAVKCVVTNVTDEALTTCVYGTLNRTAASESKSKATESMPACTGRLAPHETRELEVPWLRGNAKDVCGAKTYYGTTLDWSTCEFDVATFNPGAPAAAAIPAGSPAASGATL